MRDPSARRPEAARHNCLTACGAPRNSTDHSLVLKAISFAARQRLNASLTDRRQHTPPLRRPYAFPGVSADYEEPTQADLVLGTHELDVDECVDRIMRLLEDRGMVKG